MTLSWVLFEICVNGAQSGLALYFGIRVFDRKPQFKSEMWCLAPFWILSTVALSAFTFIPMPMWVQDLSFIPCALIFLALTGIFYEGRFHQKLICCIVYFVALAILTILAQVLTIRLASVSTSSIFSAGTTRLLHMIAICALQIPMTMLMVRIARLILNKANIVRSSYGIYVIFVVLPITSLVIVLIMLGAIAIVPEEYVPRLNIDIAAVALLLVNLLVIWIYDHVNEQNALVVANETEKQKMAFQLQHYDRIEKMHNELMFWEHDKRKHLRVLSTFLEMGESGKASQYISELVDNHGPLVMSHKTGNLTMDAVVNAIGATLGQDHIHFTVKMSLQDTLPIKDNDLIIIICNLLENAHEACLSIAETDCRNIRLTGTINGQTLAMQIINSTRPACQHSGLRQFLSRDKRIPRGQGLTIVQNQLNKYGGYIACMQEENTFRTDVIIPLT